MRLIAVLILCIPLLIGCQAPLMHPRSLLAQGEAYLEEENYTMAECDSALSLDGEDADAWLTRGRLAGESGQFGEAAVSYRKFLELEPESDSDVADVRMRLRRLGPWAACDSGAFFVV
jgi:predicted TPR repeat methyltransferase